MEMKALQTKNKQKIFDQIKMKKTLKNFTKIQTKLQTKCNKIYQT